MATKKPTKAPEGTVAYTVLSNLDHDGHRYTAGEAVYLDDAEAAPLLAAGVVEPAKAKA
jgi:hypothetical protein